MNDRFKTVDDLITAIAEIDIPINLRSNRCLHYRNCMCLTQRQAWWSFRRSYSAWQSIVVQEHFDRSSQTKNSRSPATRVRLNIGNQQRMRTLTHCQRHPTIDAVTHHHWLLSHDAAENDGKISQPLLGNLLYSGLTDIQRLGQRVLTSCSLPSVDVSIRRHHRCVNNRHAIILDDNWRRQTMQRHRVSLSRG